MIAGRASRRRRGTPQPYVLPPGSDPYASMWLPVRPDPPAGNDIFVSGAGGGSGTSAATPTTLASACTAALPGDRIVLLEDEVCTITSTRSLKDGTANAYIVVMSKNPARPGTIQYRGPGGSGQYAFGYDTGNARGNKYLHFQDVRFDLGADGTDPATWAGAAVSYGSNAGAHHIRMYGCRVWNSAASGIGGVQCDYMDVRGCMFWHIGYDPARAWSSAISFHTSYWFDQFDGFHNLALGNIVIGGHDASANHSDGNGFILDLEDDTTAGSPRALTGNNVWALCGGDGAIATGSRRLWSIHDTVFGVGLQTAQGYGPGFTVAGGAGVTRGERYVINCIARQFAIAGKSGGSTANAGLYFDPINDATNDVRKTLTYNQPNYFSSASGLTGADTDTSKIVKADPLFVNPPASYAVADGNVSTSLPKPWDLADALSLQTGSPARLAAFDPRTHPAATANMIAQMNELLATDLRGRARSLAAGAADLGAYQVS